MPKQYKPGQVRMVEAGHWRFVRIDGEEDLILNRAPSGAEPDWAVFKHDDPDRAIRFRSKTMAIRFLRSTAPTQLDLRRARRVPETFKRVTHTLGHQASRLRLQMNGGYMVSAYRNVRGVMCYAPTTAETVPTDNVDYKIRVRWKDDAPRVLTGRRN